MTIAIRVILIVALAAWLEPSELGLYGLIAATITLTTYFYGLDFYSFTIREISVGDLGAARYQIRDQFALFGVIYCLGTLVLSLFLTWIGLDPVLTAMTAAVAATQHAALEFYRILVRIERALSASLCFLIRDAVWVPACLLVWVARSQIGLVEVLAFWLAGSS